ncbi:type II toxin-antitoxin system prevent-host-death family antitoxin [Candidatus Peregrinibacteria bacterium]|nr:type II toxin-antitoxin system prevent-host-death family antitoxin [Candidatus Peregrinibacteria bacterium]
MPKHVPNLIGAGELQRNAATIIREVAESAEESFVVTRNEPKIVIMSIKRYGELKALEDLEFIPHRKTSPHQIRESFERTGLYSKAFLDDLEDGLKKSSPYS